jgi:uncharacterized membrane protein (DUF2068 family)
MSSLTASPQAASRPNTITGAVWLLVLVVALSVPTVIVTMDGFDAAFVAIAATLATLKLVAAGGLWRCRRWAMFLGFGVTLLDTLLSAGSIFDDAAGVGETTLMTAVAIIGIFTLILLVLPESRRAYV